MLAEWRMWWTRNAAPMGIVTTLAALFFFSFFNRFAGLRSGSGEFSGAIALLNGSFPYRDYYTAGPPLNVIKGALELGLFGKLLIVSRVCGVLERLVLAAMLYLWLARMFSRWAAALAALVTIIVSAGDRVDPIASYNHDAIFLAVLCGFMACCSLTAGKRRRLVLLAAASGLAAGLSALTKQTIGLGTLLTICVLGSAAHLRLRGVRATFDWLVAYAVGFVLPLAALALLLHHEHLLRSCVQMLFVTGPSAKASSGSSFIGREILVARGMLIWVLVAVVAAVASFPAVARGLATTDAVERPKRVWLGLLLAGFVVIAGAELLALTPWNALQDTTKSCVYYTLIAVTAIGVACIVRGFKAGTGSARAWQLAVFAGTGWAVAVTLSLSWPAFEAMALPGLALPLAAAVDGSRRWGRAVVYAAMACVLFMAVWAKLDMPFGFDRMNEQPVRLATRMSQQPMLRGMRLPPRMAELLDESTLAIDHYSTPQETIFVSPEMSLLYSLSDRRYITKTSSHNIDVVPDVFAREEAARLLANPPAVVVYARPTDATLAQDEAIWRGGRPSGQRDLRAALDAITARYSLLETFCVSQEDQPVRLYVKDMAAPHTQPITQRSVALATPCGNSPDP